MYIAKWIAFICFCLIWVPWLLRRVILPKKAQHQDREWLKIHANTASIQTAEKIIGQLYAGVNIAALSTAERKQYHLNDDNYIYGEIEFVALAQILLSLKLDKSAIFYDLGCGGGKTIYSAALIHPFKKACGIELLPYLCATAKQLGEKFTTLLQATPTHPQISTVIEFIQADMLSCDISDATVVFINATCFYGELWQQITLKLLSLAPDALIIVTSLILPEKEFHLRAHYIKAMTWGRCNIKVYQRYQNTSTLRLNP